MFYNTVLLTGLPDQGICSRNAGAQNHDRYSKLFESFEDNKN